MDRFATRRDKLLRLMKKQGLELLLVSNPKNVSYLTGFTGDDSYLVFGPRVAVIVSDSRFTTQLEEECPQLSCVIREPGCSMAEAVSRVTTACKATAMGIEGDSMTVAHLAVLQEKLGSLTLPTTTGLIESLRAVKDKDELETLQRAIRLAERGFTAIRASLRGEQTEKQVADELEHVMKMLGARGPAFPPIIAAGARAALPHARPTDQVVGNAELLLIDWGADVDGYKSDLTRVLVRDKISPKLERVYGVVARAQERAIAAIRPGATCGEIDRIARETIAKAGFGRNFGHGLGHGIGLDIHEGPRFAVNQPTVLEPGMVVTVEPGIYLPGWGGVRLEDDVLVTRQGHEVLTHVPKALEEMVLDY